MAKNSTKTVKRVIGKPFKKGEPSPNPEGRPLGQKNYATLYREALIKLAKLNNKQPDELELELISKGIMSARGGDYRFYKDILDRLLGKAQENIKINSVNINAELSEKDKESLMSILENNHNNDTKT